MQFDGTNPITDILGDEPTVRNVTLENTSRFAQTEPLTRTKLLPGQSKTVEVTGDLAYTQIMANIQQINSLAGYEMIILSADT